MSGDYLGSDDLDAILESSRNEASSSRTAAPANDNLVNRQELKEHINDLQAEVNQYDERIARLQHERQACVDQLRDLTTQRDHAKVQGRVFTSNPRKGDGHNGVNYLTDDFDWSQALEERKRSVFNIESFRLCQRGVCNAAMDDRDIVVIMPTGGGKSLTYQLPALFGRGVTLVISPLISLITDQIMHLREAGVEAVKLTGSTSKSDANDITRRLRAMADRSLSPEDKAIRLCYVTPEKIGKSNMFKGLINKLATSRRLDRIVIDEAHCVSQLGHDFRPDYGNLHVLRQLCPGVPITALSATCPPEVLDDLIRTLHLRAVIDGLNAPPDGTCLFTAPLYRKNLRYKVVPKPATIKDTIQWIVEFIMSDHARDTGIIYCCSKKDTEEVAKGLYEKSEGKIKTGVYHADKNDKEREALHAAWHEGHIKVVCATIAFGLGIDKGDVRFVIHEKMSKSLDGYYQESGRAGRDGKLADCVLLYRAQDYSSLGAIVSSEKQGQLKLKAMVEFGQNIETCRKVQFADYFSFAAKIELSSWATDEVGARDNCGHCDNCIRPPECKEYKDLKVEAWQILKVVEELESNGGNATVAMLASLTRGKGGPSISVSTKGKGRSKKKSKQDFDVAEICGGPVALSADDAERLILQLLLKGFLKERIHVNAYSTIVYLVSGSHAIRLTRLASKADVEQKTTVSFPCCFPKKEKKPRKKRESKAPVAAKRKPRASNQNFMEDEDEDEIEEIVVDPNHTAGPSTAKGNKAAPVFIEVSSGEDEDEAERAVDREEDFDFDFEDEIMDDWAVNQRGGTRQSISLGKRRRGSTRAGKESIELVIDSSDIEVE